MCCGFDCWRCKAEFAELARIDCGRSDTKAFGAGLPAGGFWRKGRSMPEGFTTFTWLGRDALLMFFRICFDDLWGQKCTIRVCWSCLIPVPFLADMPEAECHPVAVPLTPFGISLMGWNYVDGSWLQSALPWTTGRSNDIFNIFLYDSSVKDRSNINC